MGTRQHECGVAPGMGMRRVYRSICICPVFLKETLYNSFGALQDKLKQH
jgi:hypothetical protein